MTDQTYNPAHDPTTLGHTFWRRIDRSGDCWPWLGSVDHQGYGRLTVAGRQRRAHHLAWELCHGPVPTNHVIKRTCDNRLCCNPDHLRLVSSSLAAESTGAGKIRGIRRRQRTSRLTPEDVQEIRRRYAVEGLSQSALAREYAVSQPHIGSIVRSEIWRDATSPDPKPTPRARRRRKLAPAWNPSPVDW